MAKTDGNFRAWLGLQLVEDQRDELELWLREAFAQAGAAGVRVAGGPQLTLHVATLAGRRRQLLQPLVEGLEDLVPGSVRVEFAGALRVLPSQQRPYLYVLSARCRGLVPILRKLAPHMLVASGPVRPGRVLPYLPVGWVKPAAQPPRQWPPPLPRRLRGPVDAVRLGLYCSQITPESYRLDPLAQVELPVAAAVR